MLTCIDFPYFSSKLLKNFTLAQEGHSSLWTRPREFGSNKEMGSVFKVNVFIMILVRQGFSASLTVVGTTLDPGFVRVAGMKLDLAGGAVLSLGRTSGETASGDSFGTGPTLSTEAVLLLHQTPVEQSLPRFSLVSVVKVVQALLPRDRRCQRRDCRYKQSVLLITDCSYQK